MAHKHLIKKAHAAIALRRSKPQPVFVDFHKLRRARLFDNVIKLGLSNELKKINKMIRAHIDDTEFAVKIKYDDPIDYISIYCPIIAYLKASGITITEQDDSFTITL